MNLFSSLFSRKPDYPALDPESNAAHCVEEIRHELDDLASKTSDNLEIIPSSHMAYVFIGKPPKKFGMAWIHNGEVIGFNTLIQEHGFSPTEVEKLMEELRLAYEHHQQDARYSIDLEKRSVVVTPSGGFEQEVHEIIDKVIRH